MAIYCNTEILNGPGSGMRTELITWNAHWKIRMGLSKRALEAFKYIKALADL